MELRTELRRDADVAQEVGREHHVSLGGESVRDIPDVRHEAPDLVDEDDAAAWRALGLCSVGAEPVEVDHRHALTLPCPSCAERASVAWRAVICGR